jgi:Flp pilus assembly protein TadD
VDGAIAEYREAVRLEPSSAKFHYCLGRALTQRADRNGAIKEFRTAVTLDPQYDVSRRDGQTVTK